MKAPIITALVWALSPVGLGWAKSPRRDNGNHPAVVQTESRNDGVQQSPEAWRQNPPAPVPIKAFALPSSRQVILSNGLTLILAEDHRAPLVTIDIGIPVLDDPGGLNGLSDATAELLTEGAGTRSSEQLAREVDRLGGRISSAGAADYAEVDGAVLSENANRMVELAGDVALRPTFPDEEVALYKRNKIDNTKVQRQDPSFVATEYFEKALYGDHPYGAMSPTSAEVTALTRARIIEFYKSHFCPEGSVVVIAGDFEMASVQAKATSVFGSWSGPRPRALAYPSPPSRTGRSVYLIDRPGSDQADVRLGNLAVKHNDPSYFPLLTANAILGAGTSSRLFLEIREKKGYAYDVASSVGALRQYGSFFGTTETRTDVAAETINEMLKELDRMGEEPVSADDLQNAKNYLTGAFSLSLATQAGVASMLLQVHLLGLGPDYLSSYRSRIESVTARQVQDAARNYVASGKAVIVVVGDAQKLKPSLGQFGAVQVIDAEGKLERE